MVEMWNRYESDTLGIEDKDHNKTACDVILRPSFHPNSASISIFYAPQINSNMNTLLESTTISMTETIRQENPFHSFAKNNCFYSPPPLLLSWFESLVKMKITAHFWSDLQYNM